MQLEDALVGAVAGLIVVHIGVLAIATVNFHAQPQEVRQRLRLGDPVLHFEGVDVGGEVGRQPKRGPAGGP